MTTRANQEWPEGIAIGLSEPTWNVIERGRTTGWLYQVSNPLPFARAEAFAFELRQISKQGGHEVSCWFVVPSAVMLTMIPEC